ncbi:MAG: YicC family protein [Candidatus Cloacimonetes bacterium]|nr:YicC family protein [Candidatus Cloacimonadota bacterium]
MPASMTGYATGEILCRGVSGTIEIRSVNHKHRELGISLPMNSLALEAKVREMVEPLVLRGKIQLSVRLEFKQLSTGPVVDLDKARSWVDRCNQLSDAMNLKSDLGVSQLITLPGVLADSTDPNLHQDLEDALLKYLPSVVQAFCVSRQKEGDFLSRELLKYLYRMEECRQMIEGLQATIQNDSLERYRQRVGLFMSGELDENRLYQEVAILLEKADVSEELVRLAAHFKAFEEILLQASECGRSLNFLCQEIHREINTTGSKSQNLEVVRQVLELKNLLEKIREQIQNLE